MEHLAGEREERRHTWKGTIECLLKKTQRQREKSQRKQYLQELDYDYTTAIPRQQAASFSFCSNRQTSLLFLCSAWLLCSSSMKQDQQWQICLHPAWYLAFCHVRCIFPLHVNIVLYCTFYFLFRLVCLSKHSYLQWVISLIKVYANRYVHILSTETKEITLWHIRKTVKLKAPPCCQAFQTALYNVLNETPVGFCHRMLCWDAGSCHLCPSPISWNERNHPGAYSNCRKTKDPTPAPGI